MIMNRIFDKKLTLIMKLSAEDKKNLNVINQRTYKDLFTTETFASEYIKLMSGLVE
ncbi:hypothetical protein MSI_23920 [Treponema sp. JC4]|nr:hypothetical protein MSI_23920 [Treponema sp. JC4]